MLKKINHMISKSISKDLIEIRRHLHQNPELGYDEHNTSEYICMQLDKFNIPYKRGIAKTGVIAELDYGKGLCIAIRADMDALPVQEETDLPFASRKPGIMHACGHDLHATMLLGACRILKDSGFKGKIKFIFQPSEEGTNDDPENKSGGQRIVEAGVLDDVNYALALHVHPLIEVGVVGYTPGNALANINDFKINVYGKAGHAGAAPHLSVDAILVACNLVQNLHTIVSRNISPTNSAVVSITKINGGNAPNIIADHVEIIGTVRALDLSDYDLIIDRFSAIIDGVSKTFGAQIELKIGQFYPGLINDPEVNSKLISVAQEVFPGGLIKIDPMLGGEDFAFYSRKVPSMYYFIGAKNEKDLGYFVHHPRVTFNEDCIPLGSEFLAKAAVELMK
jgi:amidohydrolase